MYVSKLTAAHLPVLTLNDSSRKNKFLCGALKRENRSTRSREGDQARDKLTYLSFPKF